MADWNGNHRGNRIQTGEKRRRGKCLESIDVGCACFHAEEIRQVHIQLPDEDYEDGKCGLLVESVYRTGDAAQNSEAFQGIRRVRKREIITVLFPAREERSEGGGSRGCFCC